MTQPGMMDDLDLLVGHPVKAQFAVSLLMQTSGVIHRFLAFPSSWKGGLSDLTDIVI